MSGKAGPTTNDDDKVQDGTLGTADERFPERPGWFMEGLTTVLGWCTILPMPKRDDYDRATSRRAMAMYPVPGIFLALVTFIIGALWVGTFIPPAVVAIIIVGLWVGLTRMMHLDGLMDVGDALGSYSGPEKARKILEDPRAGAMGIVLAAFVVCIQVVSVAALLQFSTTWLDLAFVAFIPIAARIGGMVSCARPGTPFKSSGFGALIIGTIPRRWIAFWAVAAILFWWLVLYPEQMSTPRYGLVDGCTWVFLIPVITLALAIGASVLWVRHLNKRFEGLNGDCVGSTVEIAGAVSALTLVVLSYLTINCIPFV